MGLNYIGLKIPVGRIQADDLEGIATLAQTYGTGEIRLAANQAMIIPNVNDRRLGDLTEETLLKHFLYNPTPVQKGLVSCVGNDYCNLAVIETKSRAVETAKRVEAMIGTDMKPITMHWSGCPAACGNHLVADVGLLGKKIKIKGEVVEAVDVFVGGRSGPNPKPAIKLFRGCALRHLAGSAQRYFALSLARENASNESQEDSEKDRTVQDSSIGGHKDTHGF